MYEGLFGSKRGYGLGVLTRRVRVPLAARSILKSVVVEVAVAVGEPAGLSMSMLIASVSPLLRPLVAK